MLTVVLRTEKVISHDSNMMPVIEKADIKLNPEMTFNKFVGHLPEQNFKSVKVVKAFDDKGEKSIEQYQNKIDAVFSKKESGPVDYKALSEKQAKILADMEERLKALEGKSESVSDVRKALETEANRLELSFRSTIGDEKLLAKIKEINPEFEL